MTHGHPTEMNCNYEDQNGNAAERDHFAFETGRMPGLEESPISRFFVALVLFFASVLAFLCRR